jgi:glycosyltransferase involved in cell wall biosynthesis
VCEGYRSADVNILASRTEGYPKVLTEGMLHGSVPVAADVGINALIVAHGQRGETFPHGDHEALARVLEKLLGQPELLEKKMVAGREYTRTVTLEAFAELHRRVLAEQWGLSTHLSDASLHQRRPAESMI